MKRIGVFDTETTGLPLHSKAPLSKQPHIIEFAIAHLHDGVIASTYTTLLKPPVPITDEITKITGLTDADVEDAQTFEQAWPMIKKSIESVDILVAHNLPFDESLLKFEMERAGVELVWPEQLVCTVQLYIDEYGRRVRMQELYELKLGKPLHQTHRALDDVNALCEIFIHEKLWEVL